MTTIKIDRDVNIKGCASCPFCRDEEFPFFRYYCIFNSSIDVRKNPIEYKDNPFIKSSFDIRSDRPELCPIMEVVNE